MERRRLSTDQTSLLGPTLAEQSQPTSPVPKELVLGLLYAQLHWPRERACVPGRGLQARRRESAATSFRRRARELGLGRGGLAGFVSALPG